MMIEKGRIAVVLPFFFLLMSFAKGYCDEEESSLFWPPPPAEVRISFVKSIYSPRDHGITTGFFNKLKGMITGKEKDILNKPIAVAVSSQKTIFICDPGRPALHILKQRERRYKKVTAIKDEELISPVGVAVSDSGMVFLSDSGLKKVFCLDADGRLKFFVGEGRKFLRPTGLAVNKDRLYVVDTAAHRILIFGLKGGFIGEFGERGKGPGQFNYPTSIAADKEGRIYVIDAMNFRVQVFDGDNKFLYAIGRAGDSSGSFSRPKGVAIDSFGHIYTTDGLFDNLQIFNQKKEFLLSLGEPGQKAGEFWIPCGIAIDKDDYIYVADSYNQRVQVFKYVGKE